MLVRSYWLDHVEDIVTVVFQYIAMLRSCGAQQWIFSECAVSVTYGFLYGFLVVDCNRICLQWSLGLKIKRVHVLMLLPSLDIFMLVGITTTTILP